MTQNFNGHKVLVIGGERNCHARDPVEIPELKIAHRRLDLADDLQDRKAQKCIRTRKRRRNVGLLICTES